MFIFKHNIILSQIISVSTGTVASYAIFHNSTDDATLVDTINGQYRSIAIDTIGKTDIIFKVVEIPQHGLLVEALAGIAPLVVDGRTRGDLDLRQPAHDVFVGGNDLGREAGGGAALAQELE